ncbi:MAG: hypothetical protein ABIR18_10595, partial [Chitinophagaceae bacterium]
IFAGIIAALCILSSFFISGNSADSGPGTNVKDAPVPNTPTPSQGGQPGSALPPKPNAVPYNAGR